MKFASYSLFLRSATKSWAGHARRLALVFCGFAIAGSAIAADGKFLPGLWQFSSEGSMRGMMEAQMKELEAQLAKLPPAQQEQMRAMMEAQMDKGTKPQNECVSPEQANKGLKDEECKQDVKWHSDSKADVTMSCPDGEISEFNIEIKSPKRIESTMTITPPANSGGSPSTMNWVGSWKQAKCG